MRQYFIMSLSMISFISCTQPQYQIVDERPSEAFQDFNEEDDFSNGFYGEDEGSVVEQRVKRSTKSIERIPSFQENEFQSIKTNNRKNIKKELEVSGGSVKVNVESIPLHEFVDFIFSSVLKMNYTVDKNVKKMKQPITLNMAKPLPKKQVLAVVENILKQESVQLNQENEMLFLSQLKKGKELNGLADRYIVLGRALPSNLKDNQKVFVFAPFYYTKPTSLFNFARRLNINKVKISYLNGNIAVLDGEAFDVKQLLELINLMDSPSLENKLPYILELEYIDVKKFTKRMESILESNAIPLAKSIREVGMVLTPVEEINTLLVFSSKESWIELLRFWKNKLDVLSEVDTEHSQLYIYKVKYRKVDEFAEVLSTVLTQVEGNAEGEAIFRGSMENNQTQGALENRGKSINIKPDLHTNTLMLNVTAAQYKKMLPIIKKLDTLPLQVVVDVTLAEVTMTDTFSLGFEWALLNNKAALNNNKTPLKVSGAYSLGLGGAGIASNLFTTNLTSLINSFAEQKKLEILSRPRLVILNNQTGNINIGQQVPVLSSEVAVAGTQGSLNPVQNISYITTGMTLDVTPTINSNGSLTMDIAITLSEAQINKTSKIDSPLIINRSLKTSAVMQSGNSILLGGIISQNKSDGHGGVPYLQDLPLIGNVFKSQSENNVKTELIILINPKILKNNKDYYLETKKFKILLKSLRYLFEKTIQ